MEVCKVERRRKVNSREESGGNGEGKVDKNNGTCGRGGMLKRVTIRRLLTPVEID